MTTLFILGSVFVHLLTGLMDKTNDENGPAALK
jgi:hypothetical protein